MKVIMGFSYKGGACRSVGLANIAAGLAKNGHRVLVIDFDMEAPGLHMILCKEAEPPLGLPDYLVGTVKSPEEVMERRREIAGIETGSGFLHLLTGVASMSGGNFGTPQVGGRFSELIEYLRQRDEYDFVCIDSPSGIHSISEHVFEVSDLVLLFFRWSTQHVEGTRIVMSYLNDCIQAGVLTPRTYEIVASAVPSEASIAAEGNPDLVSEVRIYKRLQEHVLDQLLSQRNEREKELYESDAQFHRYVERTWIDTVRYEVPEYVRMKFIEQLAVLVELDTEYETIARDIMSGLLTTPAWMIARE